jgi:hypothetical protein
LKSEKCKLKEFKRRGMSAASAVWSVVLNA